MNRNPKPRRSFHRIWWAIGALLLLLSLSMMALFSGKKCNHMAFASEVEITRIEVTSRESTPHSRVITDPDQIRQIMDFARAHHSHWYAPFDTPPSGDLRVVMYHDSEYVADFHVGNGFFEAHGCGGYLIRHATPKETQEYLELLGVDSALGSVTQIPRSRQEDEG